MDLPWVERELVETAMVTVKTESSAKSTTKIPTTSNEKCETFPVKELTVVLPKIEYTRQHQVWNITERELSDLPLSKYRTGNYYPIIEDKDLPPAKDTTDYCYSTDTEIYWPLEEKEPETPMIQKGPQVPQLVLPEYITKRCKSQKLGFQVRTHKLRRYRQKYYFKCKEKNCNKTFNTLKVWDIHHQIHHKTIL